MKKSLKKWAVTAAVVLGMFALAGCSKKEDSSKDLLERVKDRGEMTVATEGTWAPWTYHDENDKLVGFDVEVAQKIAEKLGVKANMIECEWDGILAGIDAERYDTAANGIEIDEERIEKYDFSTPYGYTRTAIIVRGDNTSIHSFQDLNGKTTANTLESTYAKLAESFGAKATGVDDLNQTMELVLAGRVDATLNADVSFYDYMSVHPEANLKIVALYDEASPIAIPVRKGGQNAEFLKAVSKAIEELAAEGVLSELSMKYFGADITKSN